MVSSSSFNIGTNLKINLDDDKHIEKDKQDVRPNKPDIKSKKGDKQNIKIKLSETVRGYAYLILTSQTSMRDQTTGHTA